MLGHDPGERSRALRERVGIVLQSCGMYRHVKVHEAVAYWAGLYPHPRDVDEVIEIVGLTDKREALARTLSGGQARRLDLALALVGDPELVFLDEPTTGFDPAARRDRVGHDAPAAGAREDRAADHPLPRRGAGALRPRRDHQGRADPRRGPAGDPRRRRLALPRHLARRARRAAHAGGARSDAAPAPAHQRRARPRRAAARHLGRPVRAWRTSTSSSPPRIPRTRSPRRERRDARLAPLPARAPDVLAQPDRGVLQLRPAADLPRRCSAPSRDAGEPGDHRAGHRRPLGDGDDVQRARQPDDVPARRRRAQAHARHAAPGRLLPGRRARERGDERGRPGRASSSSRAASRSTSAGRRTGSTSRSSRSSGSPASPRSASPSRT